MALYVLSVTVGLSLVFASDDNQMLQAAKALKDEFGDDWWNLLSADVNCCSRNTDEQSCNAEEWNRCKWFSNPNNEIAQAGGSQCLGKSWVRCKRKFGIDYRCRPEDFRQCLWPNICPPQVVPNTPPCWNSNHELIVNHPSQIGVSMDYYDDMQNVVIVIIVLLVWGVIHLYITKRKNVENKYSSLGQEENDRLCTNYSSV